MYAEIPPDAIPLLQPNLQEGKIVYMTKITIHNAKSGYRPVESPYMIRLNIRTHIAQLQDEPSNFPKYTFSLTPFSNLYQHTGNT
jgi:replication factor A1